MIFPPRILSLRGLALLAGAVTIATPTVAAERQDPSGADRFPISVASVEARRASVFAEVDANGDGLVSLSEFMAHEPDRDHASKPGMFRMKDFHGRPPPVDGIPEVGAEHMTALDDAVFDALDTDGNGSLSRSEFSSEALANARREEFKGQMFSRLDADGDGYLTPAEFPPQHLSALDTDGDGEISRDELRQRHRPGAG